MCGNLELIKELYQIGYDIDHAYMYRCASESKNFEIIKWLFENKVECDDSVVFYNITKQGNFENMKWLYKHGFPTEHIEIFEEAIKQRNLNMVKWLHKHEFIYDDDILGTAITVGDTDILNFLFDQNLPISYGIYEYAVERDNTDSLEWLLLNKIPNEIDKEDILKTAIEYGNENIIKILSENGFV